MPAAPTPLPLPGCDFAAWLGHLQTRARRHRLRLPLGGLCLQPPRLTAADVDFLFPDASRERFTALVLHAGPGLPRSRREASVALLRAVRRCAGVPPEQVPGWCLDVWSTGELPPLLTAGFERLPASLRRAVLADTATAAAVRRVLLPDALRRRLAADPLAHPDTPASRAARARRLPQALDAIRRCDFSRDVIAEQLDEPDNAGLLTQTKGALAAALWEPLPGASWTPPTPAVHAALARLPDGSRSEALRFLATPPAERLRDGQPPGELLRTHLSPHDWLATFTAGGPAAQACLLHSFAMLTALPDNALFDLLATAFPHARPTPEVLGGFARHWLQRGRGREGTSFRARLLQWFAQHPAALRDIPRPAELADLLLDAIRFRRQRGADEDRSRVAASYVEMLLGGLLEALVLRHRSEQVCWFVWDLLCDLLDGPAQNNGVLGRFLAALAGMDTTLLLETVPDELRPAPLERLLRAWPAPPAGAAAERLRAVAVPHTERPAWLALLERLRRQRLPVPERLRQLALSGGPQTLRQAFLAYPDAFAEHGPDLFALRPLLRLAFRHVRVARVLEQEVSRAKLVAQLDWVRQEWGHAPSIAAALELALCFSLRDARFLCQLARQAKSPRTPEERGHNFDALYRVSELAKKNGGTRTITAPVPRLKRLQRRLLANGFATLPLHEAARGFRAGESIVSNATPHTGKALVVNLDIQSFFPSTTYPLILRACRRLAAGRLSPRAVFLLADLCSYRGALPTGAPTSPAIGNLVLTPADRALAAAAARVGADYTRYADDLTFSGGGETHRLIPFVKRVLGGLGYRIERRKINLFRRGRRQMVTGLVVNEKANWPRHLRRLLRAAVDRRRRGGTPVWHGRPLADEQLRGLIAFLNMTRPEEAANLRARVPCLYDP
jgi:Reverse transcriptase (RNA-dependent DNA polymerase)